MSADEAKAEIQTIRKIVKKALPSLSVTGGRGTAWGWVDISRKDGGTFTELERVGLAKLGLDAAANVCFIAPDSRELAIAKMTGQPSKQTCYGCDREAVEEFGCPCDMHHRVCQYHLTLARSRIIRLDCSDAPRWADDHRAWLVRTAAS